MGLTEPTVRVANPSRHGNFSLPRLLPVDLLLDKHKGALLASQMCEGCKAKCATSLLPIIAALREPLAE